MKRFVLLLFSLLVLTGCGEAESVGIIGGADGPTAIFVANGDDNTMIESVRMIKVDGELYYDSGKVSEDVPRCGTLDGNLKRTVTDFEIPVSDGECNFVGADGYQSGNGTTKEIPLDGEWVIFEKIVDEEKDFSEYKYCMRVMGKHPNAAKESEYIVLSKTMDVTFEKIEKHLFSSQLNDRMDIYILPQWIIYECD